MDTDIVYIPGNHDRLCGLIPNLKKRIIKSLNLNPDSTFNFEHSYQNVDYGVFARHGHEFDKFNYEGGRKYTDDDFARIPIGDPITTELVAKLPYVLMQRVEDDGNLNSKDKKILRRNFQEIENVRPFSATLTWLLYRVREERRLKEQIEDSVDQVINDFNDLPFVKRWYDRHDKWYNPLDEADKIQSALYFMEKFKLLSTEKLFELVGKINKFFERDELLKGATAEFSQLDSRIQYVVYGHTHKPVKIPLRVNTINDKVQQQVYLNTGTWRKHYYECKESEDFIGWKQITYLIFYTKQEKPNELDLPVFETWTGSLKREAT
jgi:UDP-2,3-diacylglucosamine pyrophosphatase LpxH